jgi:hypothetical protein
MSFDDEDDDRSTEASTTVMCPYCGAPSDLSLDVGGGSVQDYVEDCQICCQPLHVHVRWRRSGQADVQVERADQ